MRASRSALRHQPASNVDRHPSTGMINLLHQISLALPGEGVQSALPAAPVEHVDFPLATLMQIEHELLRRSLDQLDGVMAQGLGSSMERLVYEALRRTGLVLVSAALHNFQQTPGSHANLDHSLMSLFMLDMPAILGYSPSFAVFVLCTAGPFTTDALRNNARRWLADAADRANLSSWPAVRRLLVGQFFYYPTLLDPVCPLLWRECEPLLASAPASLLSDTQALHIDDSSVLQRP